MGVVFWLIYGTVASGATFYYDWIPVGPGPTDNGQVYNISPSNEISGSVREIVVHPTDSNIVYLASVNGGVWRTENANATSPTWRPLTDNMPSLSIGGLDIDPTDSSGQTLIAGVGAFSSFGGRGGPRVGVYYTTNGGTNWSVQNSSVISNVNVSGVLARGNVLMAISGSGLARSIDRGVNWTQISGTPALVSGSVSDLVGDPGNLTRFYICVASAGIFRSDDAGTTWNNITGPINVSALKVRLATHNHAGTNVVYAVVDGSPITVFRSTNLGTNWVQMDNITGVASGTHASLSATADPNNSFLVYVGTDRSNVTSPTDAALFRGNAAAPTGSQWQSIVGNFADPDGAGPLPGTAPHNTSRTLAINRAGVLLEGDDGGIYRRSAPQSASGVWTSMNGNLQIMEAYNLAYDNLSHTVIIGVQDHGCQIQQSATSGRFYQIMTNSGGDVAVDSISTPGVSFRYSSAQNFIGQQRTAYDSTGAFISNSIPKLTVLSGPALSSDIINLVTVNSVNGKRVLLDSVNALYESSDQLESMTSLSTTVSAIAGPGVVYGGISNGVPNEDLIYMGIGTNVARRTAAGNSFTLSSPGQLTIYSLAVNPDKWQHLYVGTDRGFYQSLDAGNTFSNISGNLPTNVTFWGALVITNETGYGVVAACPQGVYISPVTNIGNWQLMGTNLPLINVFDLRYDRKDNALVVATLGRGVFRYGKLTRPTLISTNNPPVIFTVSPAAAPVGTSVTITGINFGATTNDNIVYFGDVRAMVTSANTGQLQVIVPAGTSFEPISVTVNGKTAYSEEPYDVLFPSAGGFDIASFGAHVDFQATNTTRAVAVADLDGDGRPDVVTANPDSGTLSVFRNNNSSSGISVSTLAARKEIGAVSKPSAVIVADIDGDGLLDLVVPNYLAGSVSVFLNQSVPGTFDFSSRTDWATGDNPISVAVADIDGDGRPDLIVACETAGQVSVLKNVTTAFGAPEFSDHVDFVVGKNPVAVAAADLDGDGKVDVIVANKFNGPGGNSITVLRNTSAVDALDSGSFATRVTFATGAGPSSLAIGDLDGDGLLDIVTGNSLANTLSIFQNTSTPGSFTLQSLAARFDISSGSPVGGLQQVGIADFNGDGLPDLATLNQNLNSISIIRNNYQVNGQVPFSAASFGTPFAYGVPATPQALAIGDLDRDSRPELIAVGNGYVSVCRNTIRLNPTIDWNPTASMNYGEVLTTNQLNAVASVPGSFVYIPPTGTVVTASIQSLQAIFFPLDSGTYNRVTNTHAFSIIKATPVITWDNPADITYGTLLGSGQLNATATFNSQTVTGTFDYSPPAGTLLNAGDEQALSVTFTPSNTANFEVVGPVTVYINVGKATPLISWAAPSAVVYGHALGGTELNATATHQGQPVPGSYVYTPGTNTVLPAGNQQELQLVFTPTATGNFYAPSAVTNRIDVTRAPLGIRADDKSRLRGQSNPQLTATYYGFVNSENESALTTLPDLATSADEASPIGDYPITVSGAVATNYSITYTNGVLHVTGDDPPVIAFASEGLDFYENDPPLLLDPELTVTDGASPDFDGGLFTIRITSGAQPDDQILIIPGGVEEAAVALDGTNVTVGGLTVGWFQGGTNGSTPLVVHLNTNATPSATEYLARQLAFYNGSKDPKDDVRLVEFDLTDGDGGTNAPATLPVYVHPINDPPSISLTLPTGGLTRIAPGPVTFSVVTSDVDGIITKIEYYANDIKIGESTGGGTFDFDWTIASVGVKTVYAVATDDGGATNATSSVSITLLPGITSPMFTDDGHFSMVFAGVADVTYELDWSADLVSWHFLDYVTGTGEAGTVVDPTATGHEPARFYRFIPVEPARDLPSD